MGRLAQAPERQLHSQVQKVPVVSFIGTSTNAVIAAGKTRAACMAEEEGGECSLRNVPCPTPSPVRVNAFV